VFHGGRAGRQRLGDRVELGHAFLNDPIRLALALQKVGPPGGLGVGSDLAGYPFRGVQHLLNAATDVGNEAAEWRVLSVVSDRMSLFVLGHPLRGPRFN
jgi:hypothetical protein